MERARLLCELVRKREKLKAAFIRTKEQCILMKLNPLEAAMGRLLESLYAKDTHEIFGEPVDIDEVPDYMDVVKIPMDLSTMRQKLRLGEFITLDDMENDFNLMIQNCLAYNNKDTIFYRAGIRMRDQCASLFKAARRELIRDGILEEPQSDESLSREIDAELSELIKNENINGEHLENLQQLMDKTMRIKHGMVRNKRIKLIRVEINKVKKILNKSMTEELIAEESIPEAVVKEIAASTATSTDSSQSEDEEETTKSGTLSTQQVTPPCSPMKNATSSASPSGVNRRTAVLFTRKAQAAASLKKSEASNLAMEEHSMEIGSLLTTNSVTKTAAVVLATSAECKLKSPKKLSRGRRNNSRSFEGSPSTLTEPGTSGTMGSLSGSSALNTSGLTMNKKSTTKNRSEAIPDSFRMYRQDRGLSSDSDESQMSYSDTCSSCSGTGSGSDFG